MTKIYTNAKGFTCYDKYFSYLEKERNSFTDTEFKFISNIERYKLKSTKTLHDSRIISINCDEDIIKLKVDNRYSDNSVNFIYQGANLSIDKNNFDSCDLHLFDIVQHEFGVRGNEKFHRYTIDIGVRKFDPVEVMIKFRYFEFTETNKM